MGASALHRRRTVLSVIYRDRGGEWVPFSWPGQFDAGNMWVFGASRGLVSCRKERYFLIICWFVDEGGPVIIRYGHEED